MWFTLKCNRADIASELIEKCLCSPQQNQEQEQLDVSVKNKLMEFILLKERDELLELFLINDFSMHQFLVAEKLKMLYNKSADDNPEVKKQIQKYTDLEEEKEEISLNHIDQFIKVFMRNHEAYSYEKGNCQDLNLCDLENRNYYEHSKSFADPHLELFIWAVLCNKPTLVDFFLKKTRQPLLCLIFAAAYHKKRFPLSDRQTSYVMQDKANLIMDIAYENDGDIALALLGLGEHLLRILL